MNFQRRHIPGASYKAKIQAERSVSCKIKGISSERDVENRRKFGFEGEISILECDPDGNPILISFSTSSISASIGDNKNFFKRGYGKFRLKWQANKMLLELERDELKASIEEMELLSIAFRPPSSQAKLEEILGENRKFKINDEWSPPKDYLKRIFASKGLSVGDDNILHKARFHGKEANCAVVLTDIKISGVEGFDFEYSAEITLPFDEKLVPMRTKSKSTEKIVKKKSQKSDNSLLGDDVQEMTFIISSSMDVSLEK